MNLQNEIIPYMLHSILIIFKLITQGKIIYILNRVALCCMILQLLSHLFYNKCSESFCISTVLERK